MPPRGISWRGVRSLQQKSLCPLQSLSAVILNREEIRLSPRDHGLSRAVVVPSAKVVVRRFSQALYHLTQAQPRQDNDSRKPRLGQDCYQSPAMKTVLCWLIKTLRLAWKHSSLYSHMLCLIPAEMRTPLLPLYQLKILALMSTSAENGRPRSLGLAAQVVRLHPLSSTTRLRMQTILIHSTLPALLPTLSSTHHFTSQHSTRNYTAHTRHLSLFFDSGPIHNAATGLPRLYLI